MKKDEKIEPGQKRLFDIEDCSEIRFKIKQLKIAQTYKAKIRAAKESQRRKNYFK